MRVRRLEGRSETVALSAAVRGPPVIVVRSLPGVPCQLLRLGRFVEGKRVSVNDYLRSADRNFTALNGVAAPELKARLLESHDEAGSRCVRVEVANTASTTAVAVKFNIRKAESGEAVLPAYISEGHIHLPPGERRIVQGKFPAAAYPVLSADGSNVAMQAPWSS